MNESPVAQIQFIKGATPDPLFKQVLNRRSTKKSFDTSHQVEDASLTLLSDNDPDIHTSNNTQLAAIMRDLDHGYFHG
ncbi:MAG TPA: hypothetical protein EYP35_01205 [Desulfobacterales bacterium]|nr:hypothetical protein [Desulfobacterales bacterium]HIP39203.1 hypothetical protein [Desulfocapsa sulfexigens]